MSKKQLEVLTSETHKAKHIYSKFYNLTFSTLGKIFTKRNIGIFLIFPHKTGFNISCKMSPVETICMKCQNPFSGENKKKYHLCAVC